MARVELILRQSGNTDTFDADLVIFDEVGNPSQIVNSLDPVPRTLLNSVDDWRNSFSQLVGKRRGTIEWVEESFGSCSEAADLVSCQFLEWLNSQEGWKNLQQHAWSLISEDEEVQVNIQTTDERLRLMPWNEAFAAHHSRVEVSVSLAREFYKRGNLRVASKVRILAVLGNPGEIYSNVSQRERYQNEKYQRLNCEHLKPVDVDFDERELQEAKARGADIKTLKQPSVEKLRSALRDKDGWHIFFFAGHSKSLEDNSIGSIILNKTEMPLGIDVLKEDFLIAIDNGLQLAIFNSCDGLGLAQQLSELHLPQSIVMREPVPDDVAKDFLQQFLNGFSKNQSLFESVRLAKEFLREKWDCPDEYPGARWLPVIVRNPAVSVPIWSDFIAESPLSSIQRIAVALLVIALAVSLPISLFFEFNQIIPFSEQTYFYYAKLYPHIVLYPPLFLWVGYYTLYKAWCQIRNKPKIWQPIVACILIAIMIVRVESIADNMMLFELKNGATSTLSVSEESVQSLRNIPDSLLDVRSIIDEQANTVEIRKADLELAFQRFSLEGKDAPVLTGLQEESYYEFMKLGLAYQTWVGKGMFSLSRKFYFTAVVFFCIVPMVSIVFWREISTQYVFNRVKYARYIMATQLVVLCWFPLRTYHNIKVKGLMFGDSSTLSGLDAIAYPILLTVLITSLYKSRNFEPNFLSSLVSVVVLLFALGIGITQPEIVGLIFGLDSNSTTWLLWLVLVITAIYIASSDAVITGVNRRS